MLCRSRLDQVDEVYPDSINQLCELPVMKISTTSNCSENLRNIMFIQEGRITRGRSLQELIKTDKVVCSVLCRNILLIKVAQISDTCRAKDFLPWTIDPDMRLTLCVTSTSACEKNNSKVVGCDS